MNECSWGGGSVRVSVVAPIEICKLLLEEGRKGRGDRVLWRHLIGGAGIIKIFVRPIIRNA